VKKIFFIYIVLGLFFLINTSEEKEEMINHKKYIYTNKNGDFCIGSCSSQEEIEKIKGKMTESEYINIILGDDSKEHVKFRFIKEEDLPNDNYFSEAWCDVTPHSHIDIDCTKAKEIELRRMREKRQKSFEVLGFPTQIHPEIEKNILSDETKMKLKTLRDITEPLKSLDTTEKFNDDQLLEEIKRLGSL